MNMNTPLITAAICTYQRYDLLPKAIESLLQQDLPADQFQILVIDNSPPSSPERAVFQKKYHNPPRLIYITTDQSGVANARNLSVQHCTTSLLAFMDDDAVAVPAWLRLLISGFERGPQTGVVGGRVVPEFSIPRPVWLHDDLLPFLSVYDHGPVPRTLGVNEWMASVNIAYRHADMIAVGGFNTKFGRNGPSHVSLISGEDDAMTKGIARLGREIFYIPDAQVTHHIHAERLRQQWFRQRLAWQGVSDQIMAGPLAPAHQQIVWEQMNAFLAAQPQGLQDITGLFTETDDPETMHMQAQLLRMLTRIILGSATLPVKD